MDFSGVKVQADYVEFKGGLNQINTLINTPQGFLADAVNFEVNTNGGYTRIQGYERFDGRTSPSDALYYSATFTAGPNSLSLAAITGDTSGATATVVAYSTTQIFITAITGTFVSGEVVRIGGLNVGTLTSTFGLGGAPTSLLDAQYKVAAAGVYRALIGAVPGSGNILGVQIFSDTVYAFRADTGVVKMYKSTASGWSEVTFGYELSFTGGNSALLADGAAITGAVSGATATVRRVVVQSGTFGASTAAGRLIIDTIVGTWQSGEGIKVSGTSRATSSSLVTAITLTVGTRTDGNAQRFQFTNYAFGTIKRMYGCDGVNRAFEYGPNAVGTNVFTPITTGMTTDKPTHIATHRNYLFLAFDTSVMNSAVGDPYQWTVITGASEMNMGDFVTGLLPQPGSDASGALMIFCRNQISILYGTSTATFTRTILRDGIGAMPYSQQNIGVAHALDDRGVIQMTPTLNWGNFDQGTISRLYNDFLYSKKSRTSASSVHRGKNQFRLFFSDGSGIYITVFQGTPMGAIPVSFDAPVLCISEDEFSTGDERSFFGSSDGYVYELDVGPNFDGAVITGYITLTFNSEKTPRYKKKFRKVVLDGRFSNYTELVFGYALGYGKAEIPQPGDQGITLTDGYTTWDTGFWDTMIWDGGFTPSEVSLDGSAENIQLTFLNQVNYVEPFTLSGAIVQYNVRKLLR